MFFGEILRIYSYLLSTIFLDEYFELYFALCMTTNVTLLGKCILGPLNVNYLNTERRKTCHHILSTLSVWVIGRILNWNRLINTTENGELEGNKSHLANITSLPPLHLYLSFLYPYLSFSLIFNLSPRFIPSFIRTFFSKHRVCIWTIYAQSHFIFHYV